MTFPTNLVEGFFLITSDNLIFEVKGSIHPPDRVIAYVRYVPKCAGSTSYQKVYDLRERESYLKSKFPNYLWYSGVHGRILQSVSYDRIKKIFNPVEKISQMKKNFVSLSDIGQTTIMLTNRLLEFTGISETSIGVTGSQLVDLASKKSDIDIVIYGEDVCRGFYDQLANSYNLIPGIKEYSGSLLDKHLKFRWRNLINHRKILREIERKKKLQGIFEGREFFIRLVRFPEDVDEVYGLKKYELLEPCEITGIITDDSDSIFSPCSYQVESLERPNLKRLVSFRGRFTEQVSKGDSVRARGRLERVINNKSGESFDQLVLGESSSDYLMPF